MIAADLHGDTCEKRSIAAPGRSVGTAVVVLAVLTIVFSGCTSYKATVERQEDLRYEAVRVQPGWEHQERPAQKLILPAVGVAAGAVYGSQTQFAYEGRTFEGAENAALWAGVGLVAGFALNSVLLPRRPRGGRAFDLSQSEEWIENWNRSTGSDYIISEKAANNALVLAPRMRVRAIRQDYKRLEEDLARRRPSTKYEALQEWERKLSGEYSILPASEVSRVEGMIAANESKVASADLESRLAAVEAMEPTYSTLTTLRRLRRDLGPVYQRADAETRRRFDERVQSKTGAVLAQVLPEEEQKIERVGESMQGIEELNGLFEDFNRRYGMLRDHDAVAAVYNQFHAKKASVLTANADEIASQIEDASSVSQLEALEARYFAALRPGARAAEDVRRRLDRREEAIVAAERQRRIAAQSAAQRRAQAALAAENAALAAENARLTPNSFSARGARNAALLTKIYRGEFADVALERDDMQFAALYNAYLNAYAKRCDRHLPPDKVELTYQECRRERISYNNWGMETGRTCVAWRTRGTDLFAHPDMHEAKVALDALQGVDAIRNVIGMLSAENPLGNALSLVGNVTVLRRDMATVVQTNACDSPGLMRFQDNLRLFALSERPKQLGGQATVSSVVNPPPGTLFEDQNYAELLEDLVYDQARSWVMNKYRRGSISNVSVTSRDALGRPTKIKARYTYNGMNGQTRGLVTLEFDEGWPECLYFADNPLACRTPNRRIVAAYADGDYGD